MPKAIAILFLILSTIFGIMATGSILGWINSKPHKWSPDFADNFGYMCGYSLATLVFALLARSFYKAGKQRLKALKAKESVL